MIDFRLTISEWNRNCVFRQDVGVDNIGPSFGYKVEKRTQEGGGLVTLLFNVTTLFIKVSDFLTVSFKCVLCLTPTGRL